MKLFAVRVKLPIFFFSAFENVILAHHISMEGFMTHICFFIYIFDYLFIYFVINLFILFNYYICMYVCTYTSSLLHFFSFKFTLYYKFMSLLFFYITKNMAFLSLLFTYRRMWQERALFCSILVCYTYFYS